ncbi:hypothetical protein DBR47_14525 [Paucibacter sp. KBW04]|uniref:hypothetical protein n=1 Tax=Paucibacter sp. KBW04 TaxID=2153361 RepID=UPI000F584C0C|nr:hypothetical protein [Paucibacter sp. KBW04]RQO58004.1 hypothetical protein DBR47_14525 [Paucibacter sp. KBW04]
MKIFALPADARLLLTKATPRKEHHGDDLVQAISLRLAWDTTNDNLALLHPNLKPLLFWKTPAVEAQADLEGLPEITPNLRVPELALPLKFDAEFTGYTLNIEYGIDESSALELYVCALSKFTVDAREGGSVTIAWSLSSNKEITPEVVGILCGMEGEEIIATLTPPAIATGDAIDGSVEAFHRDHPELGDEGQDAGGLFAAAHGGDDLGQDLDEDEDEAADAGPALAEERPAARRTRKTSAEAVE